MTRNTTSRPNLLPFADALVEDLMNLSDEEILAEFRAEGFDPEAIAAELRTRIQGLVAKNGKARLARARAGLAQTRAGRTASNVISLPISRKQEILAQFAANDGRLRERMTMAARKGEGATELEINDILKNLYDLGAIDDEGNPR